MLNLVGFEDVETKKESDKLEVINPNTNEVVNYINKGDKIVRKTSIDAFKQIKEQDIKEGVCEKWDMKEFYKANTEELQLVSSELSQNEKVFLFSITPYIAFDSNMIRKGHGRKAEDIGTEELIQITGLSRSILYETIKTLRKKDIIYKGENSKNRQYFVNPWLYCKGNRINKALKGMFENYRIRSQGNVLWKDFND